MSCSKRHCQFCVWSIQNRLQLIMSLLHTQRESSCNHPFAAQLTSFHSFHAHVQLHDLQKTHHMLGWCVFGLKFQLSSLSFRLETRIRMQCNSKYSFVLSAKYLMIFWQVDSEREKKLMVRRRAAVCQEVENE